MPPYNHKIIEFNEVLDIKTGGKILANGTQESHIANAATNGKTDYAKTDIDDAGTIDGTELAVVLNTVVTAQNALGTKINAILSSLEALAIVADS